jgi:hypothetical protein
MPTRKREGCRGLTGKIFLDQPDAWCGVRQIRADKSVGGTPTEAGETPALRLHEASAKDLANATLTYKPINNYEEIAISRPLE